jgi:hypothetical protein
MGMSEWDIYFLLPLDTHVWLNDDKFVGDQGA